MTQFDKRLAIVVNHQTVCNWLKRIEILKTGGKESVKFERNDVIQRLVQHPDMTLEDRGVIFGLTAAGMPYAIRRRVCNTAIKPLNINKQMSQTLR